MAPIALVGVLTLGLTPSIAATPNTYFVRGTKIGGVSLDSLYTDWVDSTVGATVGGHGVPVKVEYPGSFWPASRGYLGAPTFDDSVGQGLASLAATIAGGGDSHTMVIIHGYSQGAVIATEYLRAHPTAGNTYVLIGNPNRPNGGILERFNGLHLSFLDVSFNGATPTDGDAVVDISYRYDGWADFPKYPLNMLATANALMGILYLHGKAEQNINAETLAAAEQSTHGNTTYYLLDSARLPLLMPFEGVLPDQLLDALETPLRSVIETAYDRTDYGEPTTAEIFPTSNPLQRVPEVAPTELVEAAHLDRPARSHRAHQTTAARPAGGDAGRAAGRHASKRPGHQAKAGRDSRDTERHSTHADTAG